MSRALTHDELVASAWARVHPEPNTGCWLWSGSMDQHGYGKIWVRPRILFAHRWFYEHLKSPIPAGLVIDHLCRVPLCVNPDHLEPVTIGENVRRGNAGIHHRVRMRAKTHCPQGHEYSPENTYRYGPRRHCKTCILESGRLRHLARKAA